MIKAFLIRPVALLLAGSGVALADSSAPGWAEVSAIFFERCVMCHSEIAGASKGLLLDSYLAALSGSDNGVALIAGNPINSELMRRLRGESTPRMPFLSRPLPDEQIALIDAWITAGMPEVGENR